MSACGSLPSTSSNGRLSAWTIPTRNCPLAFFTHVQPTPVAAPKLVCSTCARRRARTRPHLLALKTPAGSLAMIYRRARCRSRKPTPATSSGISSCWGTAGRILLGEQLTPRRRTFRHSTQRPGPDAVFPRRRRPRRARPDAPRIYHQRSDARARHSHHAQPCGCRPPAKRFIAKRRCPAPS